MESKPTKSWAGHGLWSCFCPANQTRVSAEEVMEKVEGGGGQALAREEDNQGAVIRVKIVMSKEELKRMVASMNHQKQPDETALRHRTVTALAPQSLEQLLHALRRRRYMKKAQQRGGTAAAAVQHHRSGWTPALQSIPEETVEQSPC